MGIRKMDAGRSPLIFNPSHVNLHSTCCHKPAWIPLDKESTTTTTKKKIRKAESSEFAAITV